MVTPREPVKLELSCQRIQRVTVLVRFYVLEGLHPFSRVFFPHPPIGPEGRATSHPSIRSTLCSL